MTLPQQIAATISRYGLLPASGDGPVIVALSGGADSSALLAAMTQLGYTCVAAHCNFHLRGAESDRDMEYCVMLTDTLGVSLRIRHFDVRARTVATGESLEMACRQMRYAWFDQLLDQLRARAIAVAHHRQDSVETFLLNLLRTTGLRGLGGIPVRTGFVIRPMLECTRQQAEEYLRSRGIDWVTDSTNAQNDFQRNRLRNLVIPLLEQQFASPQQAILATAAHLRADMALLEDLVAQKRQQYTLPGAGPRLNLRAIADEPEAAALLYRILEPQGFNASQTADMLRSTEASGTRFVSASGVTAYIDRGVLILQQAGPHAAERDSYPVSLRRHILRPVAIDVSVHDIAEFRPSRNPDILYLDAAILDANVPLRLRRWHQGDRMRPFGLKGTRLVSDILTDAKIPLPQKDQLWLLEARPPGQDPQILWIVGIRASAHWPVTPRTRRYLRLYHNV